MPGQNLRQGSTRFRHDVVGLLRSIKAGVERREEKRIMDMRTVRPMTIGRGVEMRLSANRSFTVVSGL